MLDAIPRRRVFVAAGVDDLEIGAQHHAYAVSVVTHDWQPAAHLRAVGCECADDGASPPGFNAAFRTAAVPEAVIRGEGTVMALAVAAISCLLDCGRVRNESPSRRRGHVA